MLILRRILLAFSLLLLSAGAASGYAATPAKVATSIKPIALLVAAIAPADTQIEILVPPGGSPHTYQLRPSQRQMLEGADVIFWVGPDMETFLVRLFAMPGLRDKAVTLAPTDAQTDGDEHQDTGHHDHDHHHHAGEDPHIWLDPGMARVMARKIHGALSARPDADQALLDANLRAFEQALGHQEAQLLQTLAPAKSLSLFSYHDAFRGFAEHYGLHMAGVLTLNPERSPGARHIAQTQQRLRAAERVCLMIEPQFSRQWWTSITEGLDLKISTWDPLATEAPMDRSGYLEFQQSLADAVLQCLPEPAQH
ncbi:zinc ABC transporter substrate-binding protein [Marinobacter sp. X15-166B]|uniref:zinc ABC transporter substrate-binding protein n=1 Tax=Marinobacter sp. X15-166B TaxID=1897620 RepID=UPI00085C3CFA|nr:zinc ABC transporter substrate-binding protein [Marinobacter sp. X15-166B]OEY67132.1 ABC transporter substrate-binding protein [Marinobacter sp. X15-166B]